MGNPSWRGRVPKVRSSRPRDSRGRDGACLHTGIVHGAQPAAGSVAAPFAPGAGARVPPFPLGSRRSTPVICVPARLTVLFVSCTSVAGGDGPGEGTFEADGFAIAIPVN